MFICGGMAILRLEGKVIEDGASAVKKKKKKIGGVALATRNLLKKMLVLDIPGLSVCHRHSTGTGTEDPDLINWLSVQGADEATINKVRMVLSDHFVTQRQYCFVTEHKKANSLSKCAKQ